MNLLRTGHVVFVRIRAAGLRRSIAPVNATQISTKIANRPVTPSTFTTKNLLKIAPGQKVKTNAHARSAKTSGTPKIQQSI